MNDIMLHACSLHSEFNSRFFIGYGEANKTLEYFICRTIILRLKLLKNRDKLDEFSYKIIHNTFLIES